MPCSPRGRATAVGGIPVTKASLAIEQRLPFLVRLGFGAGDFAFNLFWTGASLFLLYYYTDVMGLTPVAAGLIYFLAMAWDAVSDPLMGAIADRTRSRWGRYRPYLLFAAIPLAASYPLAYWSAGLSGAALFAWALFSHCLFRTIYTVASIPFTALQARVTADSTERGVLAAWRVIGAALGGFTVALATPMLINAFGATDAASGWIMAACLAGLIAVLLLWLCFAVIEEPTRDEPSPQPNAWPGDLADFLAMVRTNAPLLQVLLVVVIGSIAGTMFLKNLLYFFKYNLGAEELSAVALVIPAIMMLLGAPFWTWVSQKISKRLTLIACCLLGALGYCAFYLNPSIQPWSYLLLMIGIGFVSAGNGVMFWAMLPDTIEYGEARTGQRHEAKVFGLAMFSMKAALGINALLLGWLLELSGYAANEAQTASTLSAIKAIMTMIPFAGVLMCIALLWRYPIDTRFHAALREEIAKRRHAALE